MDFKSRYRRECLVTGTSPLHAIEACLSEAVLNFKFFRIPISEWNPIFSTLKSDTSLKKIIVKIDYNDYTVNNPTHRQKLTNLSSLCEHLNVHLINNACLNELQLIGLPLKFKDIVNISQGVLKNSSLQHLSFSQCKIGDEGAAKILEAVQVKPNIVWLDLSCCELTSKSGESLQQLIHHQLISRKNAAWKASLREGDLSLDLMGGLRRLTLNDNPLGDSIKFLASALHEDQWMKAIDLQFCRLDDFQLDDILQGVAQNQSLTLLDVRNNPNVNPDLVEKLNEIIAVNRLNKPSSFNFQPIEVEGRSKLGTPTVTSRREIAVLSNKIRREPKKLVRTCEKKSEIQIKRASFSPQIRAVKTVQSPPAVSQVKDTSERDELVRERQLRLTAERQVIKMYAEMEKSWSRVAKLEKKIKHLKNQKSNQISDRPNAHGMWIDTSTLEALKMFLAQLRAILHELKITSASKPVDQTEDILETLKLTIREIASKVQVTPNETSASSGFKQPSQFQTIPTTGRTSNQEVLPAELLKHQVSNSRNQRESQRNDVAMTSEVETRPSTVQRNLTSTPLSGSFGLASRIKVPDISKPAQTKIATNELISASQSLERIKSHSSRTNTSPSDDLLVSTSRCESENRLASLKNLKDDLEDLVHQFRPPSQQSFAAKSLEYSTDFDSTCTSIRSISLKSNKDTVKAASFQKDSNRKEDEKKRIQNDEARLSSSRSSSTLNLSSIKDLLGDYSLRDIGDSTLTPP